jgi:hypothetical protein
MQDDLVFELVSIDESNPPSGSEGDNWFRYQISQGENLITGYRRGSLRTVKRDVKTIVVGLNERRSGKRRPQSKKGSAKKAEKN